MSPNVLLRSHAFLLFFIFFTFSSCLFAVDVAYARLHLHNRAGGREIRARISLLYREDAGINRLDFSDSLSLDSARWDNAAVTLVAGNNHIILPQSGNTQQHTISIWYHGPMASPSSRYGQAIANHQDTITYTLSEPYGAMYWWPCNMQLKDKVDSADMFLTTASRHVMAGNGKLVSKTDSAGFATYHYKLNHPAAYYLFFFSNAAYKIISDTLPLNGYSLPYENYLFTSGDSVVFTERIPEVRRMFLCFDSLFGKYIYNDALYGHVLAPIGGGMEHVTRSLLGGYNYEIIAHELAHHWFGNAVTCKSWKDLWLNEGFATYASGLMYENISPDYYWPSFLKGRIADAWNAPEPLVCSDTLNTEILFDERVRYNRAAMVLHQLRWLIGDHAFFSGVQHYLNKYKALGLAGTADFISSMQEFTAKDLQAFADYYMYSGNNPVYHICHALLQEGKTLFLKRERYLDKDLPMPLPIDVYSGGKTFSIRWEEYDDTLALSFDQPVDSFGINKKCRAFLPASAITLGSCSLPTANRLSSGCESPGSISLYCYSGKDEIAYISLYAADGRCVYGQPISLAAGLEQKITVHTLPSAGLYHARLDLMNESLHAACILLR